MHQLESRNMLRDSLEASRIPSLLLGWATDSPREFFVFEVESEGSLVGRIGVLSAGIGVRPGLLLKNDAIVVGFNNRVAVVVPKPLRLRKEVDLLSPFWAFLDVHESIHFCALCETAVVAVSPAGVVLWRVDMDLVADFTVSGTTLLLQLADAPPLRLDLQTGARVEERG
jgi:hypothetical protein